MVKQLQLKLMLLLCALVAGSGTMWGQVTIWSENFDGLSENTTPTTPTNSSFTGVTYTCANGTGTSPGNTKIMNAKLAEGAAAPELMVGKKGTGNNAGGGSFTVEVPLDNIAGNITLKYKQNANGLKVTMTAGSVSANATSSKKEEQTLTLSNVTTSMTSVTIKFEATSTNNVRLDDIVLTGYKANVAITSIAFSEPKTASVSVGGTTTLSPTVLPANHTEVVDWESDATGVATVSSSGVVTGVAAGTAHIKAKAHGNPTTIYDDCTVTVTAPVAVTGVTLKSSTTLLLGGTETLEATVSPSDATNKNVTWSSADDTKVSVDENGVITGLALTNGTPVNITVTTEDGSKTAVCAVTVNPVPVSSVGLDKNEATLRINKTVQLSATVNPDNATDKTVSWESDDTDIATVSSTGLVTAKAIGTATITVKSNADNSKQATCTITVTDGAINLSPGDVIIFDDFSGAGTGYNNGAAKSTDFTADDDNEYGWSGSDYMSSSGLQLKASSGNITSPTVKAPYGFQLVLVNTNTVDVYIGDTKQTAVSTKTWELPNNTAFTLKNAVSNASKVTKVTITALKLPVATDVAITDPGTLAKDATGTFAYTADDEEANTASWTSATTGVITITNAATGAYTAAGRGTSKITLTLTPTDATTYRAVTTERTVTVTAPVVITGSDVAMTYGDAAKAIGATTSAGYAGTLSYVSGNTSVATVDASGIVTAVAAGTTTITISAPADAEHLYTAGVDKIINVTVNAPTGNTSAPEVTDGNIYSTSLMSEPTGWTKDDNWSYSSSYGAVTTGGETSGTYNLTSKDVNLTGYTDITLKFNHTGNGQNSPASSFSNPSSACKVYIQEGSNDPVQLSVSYFAGNDWTYVSSGNVNLDGYKNKTVHFIFRYTPTNGNNGKWEVKNFKITGTPTITANVAASGYGTYCYEYPLDLDKLDEKVKAYIVTNVTGSTVEFTQITGTIKGGVPFILYGTSGSHTLYTAASSSTVPDGNMLEGTLAPKYITTVNGDYTNFGLSGGEFVKINDGTIPAHKAYLPILTANVPAGARLSVVFNDEATTGISTIEHESSLNNDRAVYDMQGRRVAKPVKGSLYIVGGKKFVVK